MEMDGITPAVKPAPPAERADRGAMWVEKYRPENMNDILSHHDIVHTLKRLIHASKLPHLLFYGPPGTGKTSTVLACAREMYGSAMSSMVLELNASDERGIGVVREQIMSFASTKRIFSSGVKLIILDEADAMTNAAQMALRRVIEKYSQNTRFCLICNFLNRIIPALQSRCTRFRFAPLRRAEVFSRVREIADLEGVNVGEDALNAIITLAEGDMRKCLNILQSTYLSEAAQGKLTVEAVYKNTGNPLPSDIENALHWLLNDDLKSCVKNLQTLTKRGIALSDIVREVHEYLLRCELPQSVRAFLYISLADLEVGLSRASSDRLPLHSLVGTFKLAAHLAVSDSGQSPATTN